MLDLHRLRLLQEFAARGSIAKTAAVLGYTPSAVSQQLAALEREAGTALLDRPARPPAADPGAAADAGPRGPAPGPFRRRRRGHRGRLDQPPGRGDRAGRVDPELLPPDQG